MRQRRIEVTSDMAHFYSTEQVNMSCSILSIFRKRWVSDKLTKSKVVIIIYY